jgi:hypothetical protein
MLRSDVQVGTSKLGGRTRSDMHETYIPNVELQSLTTIVAHSLVTMG